MHEIQSYLSREHAGLQTPDPMKYAAKDYPKVLKAVGLTLSPSGTISGTAHEPRSSTKAGGK